MREFIKEVLVQMHRETTTDKYGRVSMSNFTPRLFGDRKDEVEQYCRQNNGILKYSTYGGRFGTYKAFTIQDPEIEIACRAALQMNENYLMNLNSW